MAFWNAHRRPVTDVVPLDQGEWQDRTQRAFAHAIDETALRDAELGISLRFIKHWDSERDTAWPPRRVTE